MLLWLRQLLAGCQAWWTKCGRELCPARHLSQAALYTGPNLRTVGGALPCSEPTLCRQSSAWGQAHRALASRRGGQPHADLQKTVSARLASVGPFFPGGESVVLTCTWPGLLLRSYILFVGGWERKEPRPAQPAPIQNCKGGTSEWANASTIAITQEMEQGLSTSSPENHGIFSSRTVSSTFKCMVDNDNFHS